MRALPYTLLLVLLTAAGTAAAQEDTAEWHFREGRKAMDAGNLVEACASFAESHRLEPAAGTLLNLAECHERRGLLASAAATYKEAAVAAALRRRTDWEQLALARFEALRPRVPILTIRTPSPSRVPGLAVTLDGRAITVSDRDTRELIDPGHHTIAASAPGRTPWTYGVDIAKGASTVVDVPALREVRAEHPAPATHEEGGWMRPVGFAAGGVGIAALAFGAVAGFVAIGGRDDAVKNCPQYPSVCTAAGTDANETAQGWATASTLGIGAGVLLLGAGAALVLLAPKARTPAASLPKLMIDASGKITLLTQF